MRIYLDNCCYKQLPSPFDAIPDDVLSQDIDAFCKTHPFKGKAKRL